MLASAESPPDPSLPAPPPAWARARHLPATQAEAAFLAGAALARLDAIVRPNPPWGGVLRRRLALAAAAATVALSGRAEGEAALRDAFHLTRPGADPGPAGRHLLAWRAITSVSVSQWRSAIGVAARRLEIANAPALQAAIAAAEAGIAGPLLAPFAAARAHQAARRTLTTGQTGEGEILAIWLADCVLAQKLNWSFVLPLLSDPPCRAGRRAAGEEGAETTRILFGYAQAAERACGLAAELDRRAQALAQVAPKLRAKGAQAALNALLDDDSSSATTKFAGLSERGARRLFDRLVDFGAVRELTGRPTFRLYGL